MNELVKNVGSTLARTSGKIRFWGKRNTPELLIATSIVAGFGSVVLAVKATTKAEPVMEKANKDISEIKEKMNDDNLLANNEYSKEAGRKDLAKAYGRTFIELTKLYGPSALCFGASVASTLGSHKVMKGRMAGLAAAYTTVERAFDNYRGRVRDKIGEKAEMDVYHNNFNEKREVTTTKDGVEKDVKRNVKNPHVDDNDGFVWVFDASHPEWHRHGRLNLDYILYVEKAVNEKFKLQGHMFLWDVYKMLGAEPSQIGRTKLQAAKVLGWLYDPSDANKDNYISFGLSDEQGNLYEHAMETLRGQGKDIFIELTPEGDILTGNGGTKTFMDFTNTIIE